LTGLGVEALAEGSGVAVGQVKIRSSTRR